MKSMSWICQGRLGEYHYYCPSANVDSWYPRGLQSKPFRRALPFSAKETSERLSRWWGLKEKPCVTENSARSKSLFSTPRVPSVRSKRPTLGGKRDELTTLSLPGFQMALSLRCCWVCGRRVLIKIWQWDSPWWHRDWYRSVVWSNSWGGEGGSDGVCISIRKVHYHSTGGDVCTCVT